MNQIFRGLPRVSVFLFLFISFVYSTNFDLSSSIPDPASGCCTEPSDYTTHFQDGSVSFVDISPPGRKIRISATIEFGNVCDLAICLNNNCNTTFNPPLTASMCPVDCAVAPTPQTSVVVFDVNAFMVNDTNVFTFKSPSYCSSLLTSTANVYFSLSIVTCGDNFVETGEDCDSVVGCDPNTCQCMRGYESLGNNTCLRTCGDGILQTQFGEECDGGAHCVDCLCEANYFAIGNTSCGTCGNYILDEFEECDNGTGCVDCTCTSGYVPVNSTSCSLCGNDQLDAGEQCEAGYSGCSTDCKCSAGYYSATPTAKDCLLKCGNGVIDDGESCEVGGNGCSDTCQCRSDYIANIPPTKDCISALVVDPGIDPNAGVIAGAVIGTVLGAGLITLGVLFFLYRRNKKAAKKAAVKSDKSEREEELVDNNMTAQERRPTEGSVISEKSGTQLTSGNDTSTTENSGTGTANTDSYLPTKSKTDLERSEDIL